VGLGEWGERASDTRRRRRVGMVCICSSEARGVAEGAGVMNTHHAVLKKKKTTTSAFWQRRDHWMEVAGNRRSEREKRTLDELLN
jgi:hypothetical protein